MKLRVIPIWRLVEAAALYTRHTPEEIKGPCRFAQYTHVRFAIMRVALDEGWTTTQVGLGLNGRDHSTIINGRRRADYLLERDTDFQAFVAFLRECASVWSKTGTLDQFLPGAIPPLVPVPEREVLKYIKTAKREPSFKPARDRKPRNRTPDDDCDAWSRHEGSIRLIAAIRREHPERCAA